MAQKGWEMGAAQERLLLTLSFGAPFSAPRSLHTTVGCLSRHHAPSCRPGEQVFLPGRSGSSSPLPSQLRGWWVEGGGLMAVGVEGGLPGAREGS